MGLGKRICSAISSWSLRNNNSRMLKQLGPDTGWDSIGDFSQAKLYQNS
jgi:glucuronate isomerase